MPIQLQSSSSSRSSIKTATNSVFNRANRVLNDLDKKFNEEDTKAKAKFLKLKYINLYGYPIDISNLGVVSKEKAIKYNFGVFHRENKTLFIATAYPNYPGQKDCLSELKKQGYKLDIYLCSEDSFEKILKTYDTIINSTRPEDDIILSPTDLDPDKTQKISLQELTTSKLQNIPISKLIQLILISALQNKASDIHFEPEKDSYIFKLRLDGVIHKFAELPKTLHQPIENRLKLLSGLKLNVNNIPQDGRFSFRAGEKEIDVRVSMLPSSYGYSIVMRLLGTGQVALQLESLGFLGLAKDLLRREIDKPQGLILTTGPTGSGKTTTLYTILNRLNNGSNKIITLEDPIEYKLPGVSQTQIAKDSGYTFASGLKSILRQDPDVVMVGEVRDEETAKIAVQAAMTGHKVLSTIHTNDASGALPRLMEMGLKGFLLADSLSLVVGQRLVRKICPSCKVPQKLEPSEIRFIKEEIAKIPSNAGLEIPSKVQFYTSKGCPECNGLGYKGRIGVYEVLSMNEAMRSLISDKEPSIVEVRKLVRSQGMVSMMQDGIYKAILGLTDIAEIRRKIV